MVAIYRICPFVLPLSHRAIHHTVSAERVRAVGELSMLVMDLCESALVLLV